MNTTTRFEKISQILELNHYPKFRFEQIRSAIFSDQIKRYSDISTLDTKLKEQLISSFGDEIVSFKVKDEKKGIQAHKILFEAVDGHQIESVRLSYQLKQGGQSSIHHSLCISTQSGCALGCLFCATGAIGFKKNLTSDEILDQVLYFIKNNLPIDSIIFMGMGEPLSNPINTFAAIDQMIDKKGLAMSPRRLSLSTVGIIPGMQRLTKDYPNLNLAFSLHSPFNDERAKFMPVTNAYPIDSVMTAIDNHLRVTNHKVFIAYILLANVNDSEKHAQALADLIKKNSVRQKLLHVNLIRYNPTGFALYQKPTNSTVERFQRILTKNRIHHTLRQDFGTDIKAACGQLAAEYVAKK